MYTYYKSMDGRPTRIFIDNEVLAKCLLELVHTTFTPHEIIEMISHYKLNSISEALKILTNNENEG